MANELTEAELENEKLLNLAKHGGKEGLEKIAETVNEEMIFKFVREDGFSRQIVDYKQCTREDLNRDPYNPDVLTKFVPVEDPINGYLVSASDWLQPSKDIWYTSKLHRIRFNPLVSRTFKMSENQIINSPIPIRQYIEGVIRNDFLAVEDGRFMEQVERCLAVSGNIINSPNSSIKPNDIALLKKAFDRMRIPLVTVLCHEATYSDILSWENSLVGSRIMQDLVTKGLMGDDGKYKNLFNLKWITTLNSDIVQEGTLYGFGPNNMLGKFYEFGSPETTVKWEDYILSIKMREVIAQSIVNVNSIAKIDFN